MGQFEEEFTRWEFWSNWALFGQFHSPGVRMRRAHIWTNRVKCDAYTHKWPMWQTDAPDPLTLAKEDLRMSLKSRYAFVFMLLFLLLSLLVLIRLTPQQQTGYDEAQSQAPQQLDEDIQSLSKSPQKLHKKPLPSILLSDPGGDLLTTLAEVIPALKFCFQFLIHKQ